MAIPPIVPINPFSATAGVPTAATPNAASSGGSFAESLTNALDTLSEAHNEVDRLAVQAATGDLNAVHDFTIAASEAQMLTQLTVEVRNKAVEAFNDIMRMQV
jgi:flagellar hook-basal body complex protein FliE